MDMTPYLMYVDSMKKMIEDYGREIFSSESKKKLVREVSSWPESVSDYRDELLLLCIKNIPQKFYDVLEASSSQKQETYNSAIAELSEKFGIESAHAQSLVSKIDLFFNFGENNCDDHFYDKRDGNVYKCKRIGSLVWMTENFRYENDGCLYPDGDESNCRKFGCLYSWQQAKSLAPVGWHLPSKAEWEDLLSFVKTDLASKDVASFLKSKDCWLEESVSFFTSIFTSSVQSKSKAFGVGQSQRKNANGCDEAGFCALPSGAMPYMGSMYKGFGRRASFWELEKYDGEQAYGFCIDSSSDDSFHRPLNTRDMISVRYVRDA